MDLKHEGVAQMSGATIAFLAAGLLRLNALQGPHLHTLPLLSPVCLAWSPGAPRDSGHVSRTLSTDVGSKGEPTADSLPEATVLCFSFFQAVSLEVLLYSQSAWTHRLPSCSREQEAEMAPVRYVTARQPEAR